MRAVCVCALLFVFTAACSGKNEKPVYSTEHNSTTLTIDGEGALQYEIVEPFEKDYYDTAELSGLTGEILAGFNAEHGSDSASLVSVEKSGDTVHLKIRFKDAESFSDFASEEFVYAQVTKARENGMSFSSSLRDREDKRITSEALGKLQEAHVVVSPEAVILETPYRIYYRSEGIALDGDYTAVPGADVKLPMVLILEK